ncbi:MAG: plasmid partition protein ParG [bacterium]|nr:plasmid partition protein ParG [bacterium]
MRRKIVSIDPRPRRSRQGRDAQASEQWVMGGGEGLKRFTVELTPAQHRRLRMAAARDGRSMADIVRDLIEDACPE